MNENELVVTGKKEEKKTKKKFTGEMFSDDRYEVILDIKADEIVINDRDLDVVLNGDYMVKNRHIGRLKGMVGVAKNMEMDRKSNKVVMGMAGYSELNDQDMYVQKAYVKSWSLKEELDDEGIMETKLGAGVLSKFSDVFLKVNGIRLEVEVEEKND